MRPGTNSSRALLRCRIGADLPLSLQDYPRKKRHQRGRSIAVVVGRTMPRIGVARDTAAAEEKRVAQEGVAWIAPVSLWS